jgi:carboxymethylenebutenolidase
LDEVDRICGPILGFWGEEDERVGMTNVHAFAQELRDRDVEFEYTVFPGLGHGFLAANFEPEADGHDAARTSWDQACRFFSNNLAVERQR